MRIRLLGDRVSPAVAWQIASELDWDDTPRAEDLAVAKPQADRFVSLDPDLNGRPGRYIPTAPIDERYR
jgi:indolepyruvate ferredoxin oxidoreductase alpha subunit